MYTTYHQLSPEGCLMRKVNKIPKVSAEVLGEMVRGGVHNHAAILYKK
jgi:hypothetical protein